jgi:hypothetical protein
MVNYTYLKMLDVVSYISQNGDGHDEKTELYLIDLPS